MTEQEQKCISRHEEHQQESLSKQKVKLTEQPYNNIASVATNHDEIH